ncbi:MAG: gamma carbonic anhydrase family protein [bacterium]|nr:gamma carbonic anhydrase family protein [bacterium]
MSTAPIVLPYRGVLPRVAADAFLAPGCSVIGDVEIGARSSVWFGCVLRGDVQPIRIGARTNIQDGTIIHVTNDGWAATIGDDVLIGHQCVIHACRLEDRAFIGMGAVVMDEAVVESRAMVAAGALVTPGKRVLSGQLWAGQPARYVRELSEAEQDESERRVSHYEELAAEYREACAEPSS